MKDNWIPGLCQALSGDRSQSRLNAMSDCVVTTNQSKEKKYSNGSGIDLKSLTGHQQVISEYFAYRSLDLRVCSKVDATSRFIKYNDIVPSERHPSHRDQLPLPLREIVPTSRHLSF
jgi:hypothetical protein